VLISVIRQGDQIASQLVAAEDDWVLRVGVGGEAVDGDVTDYRLDLWLAWAEANVPEKSNRQVAP